MKKTTQASTPRSGARGNPSQTGTSSQELHNVPAAEAQELTPAEKIDKEVWLLSDGIVDDFGTTWKLRAVHHDDSHYISYEAKINGEYASISGPHKNGNYHAHISWPAGDNLLKVLNAYGLSNYNETNLDAALKWVQQAHDLAEAAINTHVNQARTAAALRKLEQQRDEAIADLNQKFEKQASEIQQKAGLSPS